MNKQVVDAIKNQNVIEFDYEGEPRVVEPHCYGLTAKQNEGLRAFQIDGYSSSGKMGWKMYDLSKVENLRVLEESFQVREGYNPGDKGMSQIYCEI